MSLNFGEDDPREHHKQLVDAINRLKEKPLDVGLGQQAAKLAWELCDWIGPHDPNFAQFQTTRQWPKKFQDDAKANCPELNLLQDVANAAKHHSITRYQPKVVHSQKQSGFSRAFSNGFAQAGLYVEDDQGRSYLLDDLLEAARDHWDQKLTSFGL